MKILLEGNPGIIFICNEKEPIKLHKDENKVFEMSTSFWKRLLAISQINTLQI